MHELPGWGSWTIAPLLWLLLLGAGWWYAATIRQARRTRSGSVSIGGCIAFTCGLLVLLIALGSPLNTIADRWLLLAAMLQHTLVADIAPPLIVLGLATLPAPMQAPAWMRRHTRSAGGLRSAWEVMTRPTVAVPLWAITLVSFSTPPVFDFAVQHQVVHAAMHTLMFTTGLAMWWAIINPTRATGRDPGFGRVMMLAASRGASALVCLPLTFLNTALYSYYTGLPRGYGLDAVTDQRLAGASMCLIEFLVFGIAVAIVFIDVLNREEHAGALADLATAGR